MIVKIQDNGDNDIVLVLLPENEKDDKISKELFALNGKNVSAGLYNGEDALGIKIDTQE